MWVGQRVGITIVTPGDAATALVATLVEIVGTSSGVTPADGTGLTIVHLDQTDAESGAASIREMAARHDPNWAALVEIEPLPAPA